VAKRVIFHFPLKLDPAAASASGIRPMKMLGAFQAAGFEVIEVTGYSGERGRKIREIEHKIRNGLPVDFVYSESSTMPTALTDPSHLPHPFLDSAFFAFCRGRGIPIGLFYRDIYWKFPAYYRQVGAVKGGIARVFYRRDLACYARSLTRLYVPSRGMADYIDDFPGVVDELPPGCDFNGTQESEEKEQDGVLKLLYVGGFGEHYPLRAAFDVISRERETTLTVCTRREEWEARREEYCGGGETPSNITVVHRVGAAVEELYKHADMAVLFVQPQPYRNFAVPYKLFEYIGHGMPVIASEGTWAGSYVAARDIGWTIPYTEEALRALLRRLRDNPGEVAAKRRRARELAAVSTWTDRARKVAVDLTGGKA